MSDQERFCINCSECYDQRTFEIPKYFCCVDGREVNPHDCCALHGFLKESEQNENTV